LTFVTGNKKKLEEVIQILSASDAEKLPYTITNKKIDLPELQGSSPEEIAKEKCKLAAKEAGGAVMCEDTCLCYDALKGLPGPYIKWFLEKLGLDGLVKLIAGWDDKGAYASAIFAFSEGAGEEPIIFEGRTLGKIVSQRGPPDFGWDPVFEPSEGVGGKTFAEMTKDEKNAISHRAKALAKLRDYLIKNAADLTERGTKRKVEDKLTTEPPGKVAKTG